MTGKKPLELFNLFAPLAGRAFSSADLAVAVEQVYLDAIDKYYMPDGLDPIHYLDLALDLNWVRYDESLGLFLVLCRDDYVSSTIPNSFF